MASSRAEVLDLTATTDSEVEPSEPTVASSDSDVPRRTRRRSELLARAQRAAEIADAADAFVPEAEDSEEESDSDESSGVAESSEAGTVASSSSDGPPRKVRKLQPAPLKDRPWLPASICNFLLDRASDKAYRAEAGFDPAVERRQRKLNEARIAADNKRVARFEKQPEANSAIVGPVKREMRSLVADEPKELPPGYERQCEHWVNVEVAEEATLDQHSQTQRAIALKAGDCVEVYGGRSSNGQPELWIGRVMYFFRVRVEEPLERAWHDEVRVHVTWFESQSTVSFVKFLPAHFLLAHDGCADISLSDQVIRKVRVTKLAPGQQLPPLRKKDDDQYYYWATWDSDTASCLEASTIEDIDKLPKRALDLLRDVDHDGARAQPECVCCARKLFNAWDESPHVVCRTRGREVLHWQSEEYHIGDTVLIIPPPRRNATPLSKNERTSFLVGQIVGWDILDTDAEPNLTDLIQVSLFVRADEVFKEVEGRVRSERELVYIKHTDKYPPQIQIQRLAGKVHIEHWEQTLKYYTPELLTADSNERELIALARLERDEAECYFVRSIVDTSLLDLRCQDAMTDTNRVLEPNYWPYWAGEVKPLALSELQWCSTCRRAHIAQRGKRRVARALAEKAAYKAPGVSFYSGGGLLDDALSRGNPFESTKHFCEMDSDIAEITKLNHPSATVHNEKVSEFTRRSYQNDPDEHPLPKPGSMFACQGGPPCQSFSYANKNRWQAWADPRSLEVFVYLGAILRWNFATGMIENVRGLGDAMLTKDGQQGEIFRLVQAILCLSGYQFRLGVFNAAQFGAAQVRRRLFTLFARRGVPLAEMPEPTHSFYDKFFLGSVDTATEDDETLRGGCSSRLGGHGLYPPVPFTDAISDFPPFETKYPKRKHFPELLPKPAESADRDEFHPLKYHRGQPFGYDDDEADYATPPLNTQLRARRIVDLWSTEPTILSTVTDHRCESISANQAAAIHRLGPPKDEDQKPRPVKGAKKKHLIERIREGDRITPIVTSLGFAGWQGPRIHPEQHRPLSAAELRRGQGAMDNFAFGPSNKNKSIKRAGKVIGNAVQGDVAVALGRTMFNALVPLVLDDANENPNRTKNFFVELQKKVSVIVPLDVAPDSESDSDDDEDKAPPSSSSGRMNLQRAAKPRPRFSIEIPPPTKHQRLAYNATRKFIVPDEVAKVEKKSSSDAEDEDDSDDESESSSSSAKEAVAWLLERNTTTPRRKKEFVQYDEDDSDLEILE